ncbi:MAG: FAD-dependent oxidoreductase [Rhodospirillaceae bacterium]|nr:FAD-dependent oxidoreductase [Rhodospirillaceae bacterium]
MAVVGGGACGMCAALAAGEQGVAVTVLEREDAPMGTTAMSVGFIPASGTRWQKQEGVADTAELLAADILAKNKGETDPEMVRHLAHHSAPTLEWLVDKHAIPLSFMIRDHYPGHAVPRMHGTPNRSGAELMRALAAAAVRVGVRLVTRAKVTHLFADATGRILGVRYTGTNGAATDLACDALILACSGFAANRTLVAEQIPEILPASVFAHAGSQGDAMTWGRQLHAQLADLQAYQSHGGFSPEGLSPVPWAHILRGGIQVNTTGKRFSDESRNYAERALDVLAQPDHFVWSIFDERIHVSMLEFEPYRALLDKGCILAARDVSELRAVTGLPAAIEDTLKEVAQYASGQRADPLKRDFTKTPSLQAPYRAVKVTGALYHTQGGLLVDGQARVMKTNGQVFPNLFAGGGAARGISGPGCSGYLAGNGLLTATVLGRLAGQAAAKLVK